MKYWWNYTDTGNQSSPRKVCPSITLSTTNSTWYRNQGQAFELQFTTKQTSPRWLWILLSSAMWSRVVRQTITDVLGWTAASVFREWRKSRMGKVRHIRMGVSYSTECSSSRGLFLYSEDGSRGFLRNAITYLPYYVAHRN